MKNHWTENISVIDSISQTWPGVVVFVYCFIFFSPSTSRYVGGRVYFPLSFCVWFVTPKRNANYGTCQWNWEEKIYPRAIDSRIWVTIKFSGSATSETGDYNTCTYMYTRVYVLLYPTSHVEYGILNRLMVFQQMDMSPTNDKNNTKWTGLCFHLYYSYLDTR